MAYDEDLADRVRALLIGEPDVTEKKMFGGIAFMVNGNMACGPNGEYLLVRVGADAYDEALTRPEASEMEFTKRPMRGFVQIHLDDLEDDASLSEWVDRGVGFAKSLPPKVKKR